jgi:hypothetical protein
VKRIFFFLTVSIIYHSSKQRFPSESYAAQSKWNLYL